MPKAVKINTTRRQAATATSAPAMPPKSAAEIAHDASFVASLHELVEILKVRNLDYAVTLAAMARAGKLPRELQEHFGELGRRYAHFVDQPVAGAEPAETRLSLRVIDGGAA